MGLFQKIYVIERKAKDAGMNAEQRYDFRLDESLPLLNEFGKWIAENYKTVLPKSPMGKAMVYCIPRWDS